MKNVFTKYMRTKNEEKVHSLYSASNMERIMGCPGHVKLVKKAPPQKENKYAVRGTNTHTLLEFLLKEGKHHLYTSDAKEFKEFIGYDDDMLIAAEIAVAHIKKTYKSGGWVVDNKPKLLIEQKLPLNDVVDEDCGGTADVVMYQHFNRLHVMDYKNGKGVVEPRHNKQMMTYALGALYKFGWDFKSITLTIIQPNAPHSAGAIRSWTTGIGRFEEFEKELIEAIALTKKKNAPLKEDSKYCWFCPAKDICPIQKDKKREKIMNKFVKVSD